MKGGPRRPNFYINWGKHLAVPSREGVNLRVMLVKLPYFLPSILKSLEATGKKVELPNPLKGSNWPWHAQGRL
jgi:hypothetical protein